jgi:hypothetical protein
VGGTTNTAKPKGKEAVAHHSCKEVAKGDDAGGEAATEMAKIEAQMRRKEAEVEGVEQQLRELGRWLGWPEEDHRDFVSIWSRGQPHRSYFEIEDELVAYFRLYTHEQIAEHMNRHAKSQQLTELKRALIADYRQLKEARKTEEVAQLKRGEDVLRGKQRAEEEMRRAEQQQKEMKSKVEAWKRQRELTKAEEQQRVQQSEQMRRKEEAERREEAALRKEAVDRWKEEERGRREMEANQRPARPQSAVDPETRGRIREREEQIVQSRMERAAQRKAERDEADKVRAD